MSDLESGPNRDEVKSRLRSRANVGVISGQVLWPGTVKVLRDALAVIEAQEKEIARLKARVRTYLDAPPQIKGEARRDLENEMAGLKGTEGSVTVADGSKGMERGR